MKPIPKLNLNKHPYEVVNGAIIDATNIILSNDNAVLQSENVLEDTNIRSLIEQVKPAGLNIHNIIYILGCNKEIIIFVQLINSTSNTSVHLFRYNEELKQCVYCTEIDYNNGELIGTFTYNQNNLIIAFSEYNADIKVPLRVINLGKFGEELDELDIEQLNNKRLHSICPEIRIPEVTFNYKEGNCYKGWHYIFVRYKIAKNNYTQWFNTNEYIFVDNFYDTRILDYTIDKSVIKAPDNVTTFQSNPHFVIDKSISNNSDICDITYNCNIHHTLLNYDYKYFQIGIVIIRKDNTKVFRTNDIEIKYANNSFEDYNFDFANNFLLEYNLQDIITSYYNYYNVKSLTTCTGRLYIGNYEEQEIKNIRDKLKDIEVSIKFIKHRLDLNILTNIYQKEFITAELNQVKVYLPLQQGNPSDTTTRFFTGADIIGIFANDTSYNEYNLSKLKLNDNDTIRFTYYKERTSENASPVKTTITIKASQLRFYPWGIKKTSSEQITGIIVHTENDGVIINDLDRNCFTQKNYFPYIDQINGNNLSRLYGYNYLYLLSNGRVAALSFGVQNREDFNKIINRDILNSCGIFPEQPYNFFIHFIDKYGNISNGFNLSEFKLDQNDIRFVYENNIEADGQTYKVKTINYADNIIDDDSAGCLQNNKLKNTLIYSPDASGVTNYYLTGEILLNFGSINIEDYGYIGYCLSYEKFEKRIKHKGLSNAGDRKVYNYNNAGQPTTVNNRVLCFYNDDLNYEDEINVDVNSVFRYEINQINLSTFITLTYNVDDEHTVTAGTYVGNMTTLVNMNYNNNGAYEISKLNLYIADDYNNIGYSTMLMSNIDADEITTALTYTELLKSSLTDYYNNENKTLIPCSKFNYNINNKLEFNTKNSFFTKFTYIAQQINIADFGNNSIGLSFFDSTTKLFKPLPDIADKEFSSSSTYPYRLYTFYQFNDIPYESVQLNNKPDITFFPINLNTENNGDVVKGVIFELNHTTDLFQQKNFASYESYPKALDWYNKNNNYVYEFPKTIRRSNILQDESQEIRWRQFELEQYKNIIENKGNIIKLISIGYYFLVHTQGSLFQFNSTDTIESKENGIQLSNADIWDINYKEVVTSQLGFGGIQEEYSGIVGNFGYIFYDRESQRIYKYDNNSIKYIDEDINNFIIKLKDYKCYIYNDVDKNRLIFKFFKDSSPTIVISYNYLINTFISRHNYNFYRGFNTKEYSYVINDDKSNIQQYNDNKYNTCDIHIMMNDNYQFIKYLEFIIYRLCEIEKKEINNCSPVEGMNYYYGGDELRVYSDMTDTGIININTNNNKDNVNILADYQKPYWKLGNWHFQTLRDKLMSYIAKNNSDDNMTRIYGNWFVIEFKFNNIDNTKQIEIENIDVQTINAESL